MQQIANLESMEEHVEWLRGDLQYYEDLYNEYNTDDESLRPADWSEEVLA